MVPKGHRLHLVPIQGVKKSETAHRDREPGGEETRLPVEPAAGPAPAGLNRREYLSVAQLAELTPWSPQAIRTLVSRGRLRQGEHYFKPLGTRLIFKWSAIQQFIEGTNSCATTEGRIFLANGAEIDLGEAD